MNLTTKQRFLIAATALAVVAAGVVVRQRTKKQPPIATAPHPVAAKGMGMRTGGVDLMMFAGPLGGDSAVPGGVMPADHDIKALESELKRKPNHAPILLKLAEVARSTGKPGEALEYLKQLAAAEPNNAEGHLELGRALFDSGDVEGAITETKSAIRIAPRDPDALYNLGAIYGNVGQDAEARNYFSQAAEASPDSPSGKRAKEALAKLGR